MIDQNSGDGRICAIFGSPHHHGASSSLHDRFLSNFSENRIDRFYCYDLAVSSCTGCHICKDTATCIHNDDFERIMDALSNAEIITVSWPLYFGGVPSPLKAIIDRSQIVWDNPGLIKVREKRNAYLFCSAGSVYPEMFDCSLKMIRYFLKTWNAYPAKDGVTLLPGTDDKKPGSS